MRFLSFSLHCLLLSSGLLNSKADTHSFCAQTHATNTPDGQQSYFGNQFTFDNTTKLDNFKSDLGEVGNVFLKGGNELCPPLRGLNSQTFFCHNQISWTYKKNDNSNAHNAINEILHTIECDPNDPSFSLPVGYDVLIGFVMFGFCCLGIGVSINSCGNENNENRRLLSNPIVPVATRAVPVIQDINNPTQAFPITFHQPGLGTVAVAIDINDDAQTPSLPGISSGLDVSSPP